MFPWLVIRLAGTEGECNFLTLVQVLHNHVQVHLLRDGLAGPHGSLIHVHLLERDAVAAVTWPDIEPVTLVLDFPAEEFGVEGSQCGRIGTIDDNTREFSYSHG